MEKVSVSVKIPALGNTYDFTVPNNMSVRDVEELILRILSTEYGISNKSSDVMLFDMNDNTTLRLECSFVQLGIVDGAKLLLI